MSPTDALVEAIADAVAERLRLPSATPLPVTWSVQEVMRQTGLGRDGVYALIAGGELEAIRIDPTTKGSKLLVIPESVVAWRDRQRAEQAPPPRIGARARKGPRVAAAGAEGKQR